MDDLLKIKRSQKLMKKVVIIDGMGRSGKALVAAMVSSLENGELWRLNHLYEYLCVLDAFKKIERDAAVGLVNLYSDFDHYNTLVSREINMRPNDVSGVRNNLLEQRALERLALPDGDVVLKRDGFEQSFLTLVTHFIFGESDLLFDALGDRLKLYLIATRHPLWAIESWLDDNWHARIAVDPRDFKLCYELDNKMFPWFARGWESRYAASKPLEQAIHVVDNFWNGFIDQYAALSDKNRRKVAFVPYEHFSVDPRSYMARFAEIAESSCGDRVEDMMKKVNLPRGFNFSEIEKQKEKVTILMDKEGSDDFSRKTLEALCADYERRFLTGSHLKKPVGVSL